MEIYAPNFHSTVSRPRGLEPGGLSARKIFRVCKRIKPWWRFAGGSRKLCLCRQAGIRGPEIAGVAAPIAELCPWAQPILPALRHGAFRYLPRADVEIYGLGIAKVQAAGCALSFFVLFDWQNNKDVLGKRTRHFRGVFLEVSLQLHIAGIAEWQAVELEGESC